MERVIDPDAFVRHVSEGDPSGPRLGDTIYPTVKDAMAARAADPAYGVEERRPDWLAVVKLCAPILEGKSKDLFLAVGLLEALACLHGAQGLREGLWLVRALHERFWDDFHPRMRGPGSFEGRTNQLEALRRAFPRIVGRVSMAAPSFQLTYYDWKHVGAKLPTGEASPWTAEARRRAVAGTPGEFYETARESVRAAREDLTWLASELPRAERYGRSAPWLGGMVQELTDLIAELENALSDRPDPQREAARQLLSSSRCSFLEEAWLVERLRAGVPQGRARASLLAAVRDDRAGQRPPEGWPSVLDAAWKEQRDYEARASAPSAPEPEPLPAPVRLTSGDPLSALFESSRALRRLMPEEPAGYSVPRHLRWTRVPSTAEDAGELPAPTPPDRERLRQLAEAQDWKALLEASESLIETSLGASWLDLQRYSCLAMYELGAAFVQPRRAVIAELRTLLSTRAWLSAAKLADGTPAADDITRRWLAEEASASKPDEHAPARVPAVNGTVELELLEKARALLKQQGFEPAAAPLREALEGARSRRERAHLSQALGELCLEAKRPELAVPILEGVHRTLDKDDLGGWEGPAFVSRNLTALFRGYAAWDSTPPDDVGLRRQRLAEEIARVDLGLRLQLETQRP